MNKKIAFIGNLGNCTYWYVKYLRQAGIDVCLYITFKKYNKNGKPDILFSQDPREEDKELGEELPSWIKFFHVYSIKNLFTFRKEFNQYDLNVAFESMPIFLQFCQKPLISFATGSNLREDVFKKGIKGFLLKRGFLKAKMVLFDNIDMETLEAFKKLGIKKYKWIPCYILQQSLPEKRQISKINDNFLDNFKEKFICFSSARLDFNQKGTDILIRGFASFIKKNKNRARLLIIDYGKDREEVKRMIKKLNIENSVSILPLLSWSEVIELYKKSSLTFGYFRNNTSGVHHFPFSIMDALKTGSISISSIDRVAFQEVVGEEPFIFKAFTEKDIEEQINFTFTNYNKVKNDFAVKGPLWVKKYHSKEFIIKRLLKIIDENAG